MSKIEIFGAKKEPGFLYVVLPVAAFKSKGFQPFLQKYFPDYLKYKEYEKMEKDCPFCNPPSGQKKSSKPKHGHDETVIDHEKGRGKFLIKGKHELHLIFEGPKADEISAEFDDWFKFFR